MVTASITSQIAELLDREEWRKARKLLELEREESPGDHWVLTQLGVTYYEQFQYEEALKLFLASIAILSTCPLTLWNLAGTLDALGNHAEAADVYTWLLQARRTAKQDPCWQSKKWTDALKTDCFYRLGTSLRHLGKTRESELCLWRYIELVVAGNEGAYSIEKAVAQIKQLHPEKRNSVVEGEFRKVILSTLAEIGVEQTNGRRNPPPKFGGGKQFPGRRVASTR